MSWAAVSSIVVMRENTNCGADFLSENAATVLSQRYVEEIDEESKTLYELMFEE